MDPGIGWTDVPVSAAGAVDATTAATTTGEVFAARTIGSACTSPPVSSAMFDRGSPSEPVILTDVSDDVSGLQAIERRR